MSAETPSWIGLIWATLPMLAVMAVLAWRGLGQVDRLAIAAVRLTIQIALLGSILGVIFAAKSPLLMLLIALGMTAISAYTVGSRQSSSGTRLRLEAFGAILVAAASVMSLAIVLVLDVHPWYDARIVIPMLGMILGNSVNGVALAAERLDNDLRSGRELIELRLSLGAHWRQASLPAARAAVAAALTPTINSMMIAGIVAVPGMMTGQILAGADVHRALRYQILMYLLIAGTVGISTLILLWARLGRAFTQAHQLRCDVLEIGDSS